MAWEWISGIAGDDLGDCINQGWYWVEGNRSWGAITLWRRGDDCWETFFVIKVFVNIQGNQLLAAWIVRGSHQVDDVPLGRNVPIVASVPMTPPNAQIAPTTPGMNTILASYGDLPGTPPRMFSRMNPRRK